jgi:hypothetical protein
MSAVLPATRVQRYPEALTEWAGHRSGGVRRMFDSTSGRPSQEVIRTPLLKRLEDWSASLASHLAGTPRIVLLIGGPGNGKTEAVEATLTSLDREFKQGGALLQAIAPLFCQLEGRPPARRASAEIGGCGAHAGELAVSIVQDASVTDPDVPGISHAELLLRDLEGVLADKRVVYLACINRGVLDDALILAIDQGNSTLRALLETIIRSVGLSPNTPACWPLDGYPDVAIWPMDIESLIVTDDAMADSPAAQLVAAATREDRWPVLGSCAAGDRCPYCLSREYLDSRENRNALLQVLRWHEIANGKRWSFRDLFSMVSFLLAGMPASAGEKFSSPCDWAAHLLSIQASTARRESLRLQAPYLLASSLYQHRLFAAWPRVAARTLKADLRDLKLEGNDALDGLQQFLSGSRRVAAPATLAPQLNALVNSLDPALASPDLEISLSARTSVKLRDIDARFSQSVWEGLDFLKRYHCLASLEVSVLEGLAHADDELNSAELRRRRPAAAVRIQMMLRDFSCRFVRRSLGVRNAIVRDAAVLRRFQNVIDGDQELLHEAVKQVEALLNENGRFVVALNTTFGEALPPEGRRAVLTTDRQKVKPLERPQSNRPASALRFLSVGTGSSTQSIPLTYELFRSVRELRSGMLTASLPRTVIALLDTTRARLSGRIVRDESLLEGAEIRVGTRADVIARELGKFVVHQEGRE